MQYIIIDLEWNQPLSYESRPYLEIGDKLIFEMIQIGAVKLNDRFEVEDSISIPIRPQHYVKIHPRIRRMTQLGEKELADAPVFQDALEQFVAWCGEEYMLLTWGCDDVSVLQQNMDFFHCSYDLPKLCDIQRMFSDVYKIKERMGLKKAMEMMEIEPEEERYFHNALHDAYYTALVFAKMPEPEKAAEYPQEPKSLIHMPKGGKTKGVIYQNVKDALTAEALLAPGCPVCGKKMKLKDDYVRQTPDKYLAIARCPHHRDMMVRVKFRAMSDGRCMAMVKCVKSSPVNAAYISTKRIMMAEKDREYLELHGEPFDPDMALKTADRTNMPFADEE